MTKIPIKPKNYQNTPKTHKMTKICPKPKITKIPPPRNIENDQNTPETQKMTKILSEPKKLPKYPQNPKNDQHTPET